MNLGDPIFRHPELDFASIHIYRQGTIDDPRDTVGPAISTGQIVRKALAEIRDRRPFLDTEHGPIHTFKDKRRTLPATFDDEYFRHMQWAHLASGGAGGGMRWPNRNPHTLTPGMRRAQHALSRFMPLIDWRRFRRRNLNAEIKSLTSHVVPFGCADETQGVVWLLRTDTLGADGTLNPAAVPLSTMIRIPGLSPNLRYRATGWDTSSGSVSWVQECVAGDGGLVLPIPALVTDVAVAVRAL
jgi:mannan endo-1,4-beta-mannosidase